MVYTTSFHQRLDKAPSSLWEIGIWLPCGIPHQEEMYVHSPSLLSLNSMLLVLNS